MFKPTGSLWVADLLISPKTAEKIIALHGLSPDDVRDEIVCREGLRFKWDNDAERGWRVIVKVTINGRPVLAVLYPADNPMGDIYHLGSAYPVPS